MTTSTAEASPEHITETVNVPAGPGRTATFTLRLPFRPGDEPVPVLLILAGIKTNARTMERLPAVGHNAVIAYHYDYDQSTWKSTPYWRRAIECDRMSRQTPAQVAAILTWMMTQPWCDRERINLAGGSLGAYPNAHGRARTPGPPPPCEDSDHGLRRRRPPQDGLLELAASLLVASPRWAAR